MSVVTEPSEDLTSPHVKPNHINWKKNNRSTTSPKEVSDKLVSEFDVDSGMQSKQSKDETTTLTVSHENIVEGNTCFKVEEVSDSCHTMEESDGPKCNDSAYKHEAVDKIRDHIQNLTGKENCQRSFKKPQIYGSKGFHCIKDENLLQKDFPMKYNRFSSKGLSRYPTGNPYRCFDAAWNGVNHTGHKVNRTIMCHNNADVQQRSYCSYYTHSSPAYWQHMTQLTNFNIPIQGGFQGANNVGGKCYYYRNDKPHFVRTKQFTEHTPRKDVASRTNAKKWVPVGSKELKITEKSGYVDKENNAPSSSEGLNEMNSIAIEVPKSEIVGPKAVNSCDPIMSLYATHKMKSVESEVPKSETVVPMMEIPNVTPKLQLVFPKGVERETQILLADFQRLLLAAAPVISSSFVNKKCNHCMNDQPSSDSLCIHQRPNVSLGYIWEWYEKPGCYGLGVKTVPSRAYFVPYLSAIQLFDCSHQFMGFPDDVAPSVKAISSPFNSSNCKLVFEFFESEPPVRRMSLHDRILDLINRGTYNPQVYGDPRMLHLMKLCDIHPTSWFSVAWYPIYRIPEGTFRASFLTYHSFATLSKEKSCVRFPVVGMESYNAKVHVATIYKKDEGWFDLKIPNDSKQSPPTNRSQVLTDQLASLQENASLFARGRVCKNGTTVFYRHPDYEFFLSRK